MLKNIPAHVIAGPLGAGKTSLIQHLMTQKPAHERWAVLINEFGQIGLDAALLNPGDDTIVIAEVAGGCVCCVNGAPFQIGLSRLLRKARPDRLFIEPSGLGHPAQIMKQLSKAPWLDVLALQPCVMVLDAQALAAGKPLSATQQEALNSAGLVVMNKSHDVKNEVRERIETGLPKCPVYWTEHAKIPLNTLLSGCMKDIHAVDKSLIFNDFIEVKGIFIDRQKPSALSSDQSREWSVGWRWDSIRVFDLVLLENWLKSLSWRRAKLVIRSPSGWFSANSVDNSPVEWISSQWNSDSRLELIFDAPQNQESLLVDLENCFKTMN